MKSFWLILLIVSSVLLGFVLLRQNAPKGWLMRLSVHLILAAMALYTLNFSGWVTGWYVPLNPLTISTVAVLGVPGVALVLGLQWTLLV